MLEDVDATLREFLTHELSTQTENIRISFASPDSEFRVNVQPPAIGLFLYDVRENLELRRTDSTLDRQENRALIKRPSVRIDCSYLITAWATETADAIQAEHFLLGKVMQVLLRYRSIPTTLLQGRLRQQELPVRLLSMRPSLLQGFGEFWQAIGAKPKAFLSCTVTIAVPIEDTGMTVALVTGQQLVSQPKV
ncbi:DUF4255 domain-containing protein [Leptolyngbya sp. AN03gr2]|uniref:DUF4255 domain-containing protein n=1 Tax=unclassified Leptolyngbya TaxID=2650499 RepID=UPI003D3215E8